MFNVLTDNLILQPYEHDLSQMLWKLVLVKYSAHERETWKPETSSVHNAKNRIYSEVGDVSSSQTCFMISIHIFI